MPKWGPLELAAWARSRWPGGDPGPLTPEPLAADGSVRLFVRLKSGGLSLVAMGNPDNPLENRAWLYLAGHLGELGLPVARVLDADIELGLFLMEDLGRRSLQEAVQAAANQKDIETLYEPVLAMLARLQAKGGQEFDASVCFDSRELTPEFLLEREAGYFLAEFVLGACGLASEQLPSGLDSELAELCQKAGQAGPKGLTHRDLQSRNIVYEAGRLGLVDFQGARWGPAQYDLASLLHDPYVDLAQELRDRLKSRYMELRAAEGSFDAELFEQGWPFVSASRVMQALGAYAFLTRRRGRAHFAVYIDPALATLRRLCRHEALAGFRSLRRLLESLPLDLNLEPLPEDKE
jgi:aminoglycoside/choline kinase family phosphotransferase